MQPKKKIKNIRRIERPDMQFDNTHFKTLEEEKAFIRHSVLRKTLVASGDTW